MSDGVDITKAHVPLIYVVVIVGAIVGGAWAVCTTYNKQTFEMQMLREDVKKMPTQKSIDDAHTKDLSDLRSFAKERVQFYLEHAALRVSTAPGKKYMRGKIEWPIKEDDEP